MSNHIPVLIGVEGSPYSRKLRAVLRFRRIPFVWVRQGSTESAGLPAPRIRLLPQLVDAGEDGNLRNRIDTTPLIRALETEHSGRSVIPPDPVVALFDAILEDFADEWLTKAMFHYRWAFRPDIERASAILPRWARTDVVEGFAVKAGEAFAERQIGRLGVVGSNETTAPLIENSYERLLRLLDAHLTHHAFICGSRPGTADFGIFGQLTQLTGFDPTPSAIALRIAPRVVAWVDIVEDLSGAEPVDDGWFGRATIPDTFTALLQEAGRTYVPFLLANARACENGAKFVECTIDGRSWIQDPFPYQKKCLDALRAAYARLPQPDRSDADAVLKAAGCAALFQA